MTTQTNAGQSQFYDQLFSYRVDVAALCVAVDSVYKSIPGVDCYDVDRNAATYAGPFPVVAHPPCRAWSHHCAHQSKHTEAEKMLAPFCVETIAKFGGVLEHPARSKLWRFMGLPEPGFAPKNGFWSLSVDQSWWGDNRTKSTWLLFHGVDPADVQTPLRLFDSRLHVNTWNKLSKRKRAATPPDFAQWLVAIARNLNNVSKP